MMISRIIVIVFIVFLCTGHIANANRDVYINNGNGYNQQGGQGNTQGRDHTEGGRREYNIHIRGHVRSHSLQEDRHSAYWCSIYSYAAAYAEKGDYNTAIKICDEVIRKGDSTHRSKCSALEEQIYHQR